MGELKSARDIAEARTAGVKPLSVEERQRLHREELRLAGRAVADRYFSAGDLRLLEIPMRRDDQAAADIVRRAAMERLLEGLAGGPEGKLERIEAGLKALAGESYTAFAHELQDFLVAVKKLEDEALAEAEAEARGQLSEIGIGGSAVAGVNPRAWPAWDRIAREKAPLLKVRLDALLLAAVGREG